MGRKRESASGVEMNYVSMVMEISSTVKDYPQ
jgi:hypothetical protein